MEEVGAELTSPWEAYYRGIRKCNTTLEYLDEVPKNADLTQEQYLKDKMNYKSEARFLRAWFYWELFLRYGPVPIVTNRLDPDGDLLSDYTERPTIKEYVVDFILKELKDLESGLLSYEDYDSNKLTYGGRVIQPWARAYIHVLCFIWQVIVSVKIAELPGNRQLMPQRALWTIMVHIIL